MARICHSSSLDICHSNEIVNLLQVIKYCTILTARNNSHGVCVFVCTGICIVVKVSDGILGITYWPGETALRYIPAATE